ncbi:protein TRACHEARY ELEMENT DIFFERENTIATION-RELATED 7A-like [Arachis stenosperma]|uniref:protein TRACHEARY ELEMENT DIFFERENTIATION-RELATED 7A-like n=1 Tax=Arachis stenosperma TaxID=217475 RepID=UPI0025ABE204|nr:protein TRACHEARY ELEMENT DIFFERENTIATION-RELATED 7A-like [Arachis stenosperma]
MTFTGRFIFASSTLPRELRVRVDLKLLTPTTRNLSPPRHHFPSFPPLHSLSSPLPNHPTTITPSHPDRRCAEPPPPPHHPTTPPPSSFFFSPPSPLLPFHSLHCRATTTAPPPITADHHHNPTTLAPFFLYPSLNPNPTPQTHPLPPPQTVAASATPSPHSLHLSVSDYCSYIHQVPPNTDSSIIS